MATPEQLITKAWQANSPALKVLAPLSALYGAVSGMRKLMYQKGVLPSYQAPVPVLIIGNITVGGSGKTPLIIALVKYLQSKDIAVAVISRGYGRSQSTAALVTKDSTPSQAGDEPCLIVQSTGVPMAVGSNRGQAIDLLIKNYPQTSLIISDDGLQHYALKRDAEWIVVDRQRGFGNGKLLPQGFLREPVSRLQNAVVIYHDHAFVAGENQMCLVPDDLVSLLGNTAQPPKPSQTVYALSGIGYPKRFFDTLQGLGFEVIQKPFDDHHAFVLDDLTPLTKYPIITTAKDAVKLRVLYQNAPHQIFERIWVLPVQAKLSQGVYDTMDELLTTFHILPRSCHA